MDDGAQHRADVVAAAREANVRLVRFEYCDVSGVARCKAVHVSQLEHKLVEGVALTRAQMAINLLEQLVPVEGMEPVGEVRLVPDPDSLRVLPWAPGSASVMCDQLDHDRRAWGGCTRSYLKDVVARAAASGIAIRAAFENEYYLVRDTPEGPVPYDAPFHAPVYSAIGHDHGAAVVIDAVEALEAQGMVVEAAINEYGPGQQEISVRHLDPLGAADQQMAFRDTVRGVALRHGLLASFAPKPFAEGIGSGAHVHLSLWDLAGSTNLLVDPGADRGLSATGRHFVAGVLAHLPALVALTAPSVNSYRRLQPSAWASATTTWGFDNKEAAVRVASPFFGREEATANLEFKPCDASTNPYLALGALLACGLDGIERGLVPAEPIEHDPVRLADDERARAGARPLPASLGDALDALEADPVVLGSMDPLLARCYLAVKRSEVAAFAEQDEQFEQRQHLYRF